MKYIIMDFEWNSTYCKSTHSFFNEIIEIGAVKLNEGLEEEDIFRQFIKPKYSRRLTGIVKNLTNISINDLKNGLGFEDALNKFAQWAGKENHVYMTWGMTDLHTLIDNCRYFLSTDTIPFLNLYTDLQKYCQEMFGMNDSQNLGLVTAAEKLDIDRSDIKLHRALGDSLLTAKVFKAVYKRDKLKKYIMNAKKSEFYDWVAFKNYIIHNIENPLVDKSKFLFDCPECKTSLYIKSGSEWQFKSRFFKCQLYCPYCKKDYLGKVQYKVTYDNVELKRELEQYEP